MMDRMFANNVAAFAQDTCAASACSDMNSIILSLDAGILLASIIILLVLLVLSSRCICRNMTPSLSCLSSFG